MSSVVTVVERGFIDINMFPSSDQWNLIQSSLNEEEDNLSNRVTAYLSLTYRTRRTV